MNQVRTDRRGWRGVAVVLVMGAAGLACGAAGAAQPAGSKPAQPESAKAEQSLPTAEQLTDRYIEATGGREAYEKVQNRVSTIKLSIPAANISGTGQLYQDNKGRAKMVLELPGMGATQTGTDGEWAWEMSAMMGPRLLEGEEKAMLLRTTRLNAELAVKELYESMRTLALEDVDGKPAYKVELVAPGGAKVTQWYDKESGLIVKNAMVLQMQMGEVSTETTLSDYREVDGIKFPHSSVQKLMGMEQNMQVEKVEHDAELPEDTFRPPAEVQKLIDAKKAK